MSPPILEDWLLLPYFLAQGWFHGWAWKIEEFVIEFDEKGAYCGILAGNGRLKPPDPDITMRVRISLRLREGCNRFVGIEF